MQNGHAAPAFCCDLLLQSYRSRTSSLDVLLAQHLLDKPRAYLTRSEDPLFNGVALLIDKSNVVRATLALAKFSSSGKPHEPNFYIERRRRAAALQRPSPGARANWPAI